MSNMGCFKFIILFLSILTALVVALPHASDINIIAQGERNFSNPTPQSPQLPPLPVELHISNRPTLVGNYIGSTIYGYVYEVLEYLCPIEGEGCAADRWAEWNVWTVQNGKMKKLPMKVTTVRSHWGNSKKMRLLLIGSIAGAAQKMTENPKNQYDSGQGKFANIANLITVQVGNSFLDVQFEGMHQGGTLDCFDYGTWGRAEEYLETLEHEYVEAVGPLGLWSTKCVFRTVCLVYPHA